ncbi:RNA polymerase sigma factor, partial [Nocardia cyriacigeorgica]|uniref:RNA polymerase sigma factor n=1 Tax=Nocardia cyriacigeorgica TaxID=135487 RepID=UPI002454B237
MELGSPHVDLVDRPVWAARPNLDALDSGEMSPYPILRKLFADFGIEAMGAEAVAKMLADRAEAEDVVQEVFLAAWRRLAQLNDDAAFVGWLYRMTT